MCSTTLPDLVVMDAGHLRDRQIVVHFAAFRTAQRNARDSSHTRSPSAPAVVDASKADQRTPRRRARRAAGVRSWRGPVHPRADPGRPRLRTVAWLRPCRAPQSVSDPTPYTRLTSSCGCVPSGHEERMIPRRDTAGGHSGERKRTEPCHDPHHRRGEDPIASGHRSPASRLRARGARRRTARPRMGPALANGTGLHPWPKRFQARERAIPASRETWNRAPERAFAASGGTASPFEPTHQGTGERLFRVPGRTAFTARGPPG